MLSQILIWPSRDTVELLYTDLPAGDTVRQDFCHPGAHSLSSAASEVTRGSAQVAPGYYAVMDIGTWAAWGAGQGGAMLNLGKMGKWELAGQKRWKQEIRVLGKKRLPKKARRWGCVKVLQVVRREAMVSQGWRCEWRSDFGDFLGAQTLPRKQSRVLTIVKLLSQGSTIQSSWN